MKDRREQVLLAGQQNFVGIHWLIKVQCNKGAAYAL